MIYTGFSLNGSWEMGYQPEEYKDELLPQPKPKWEEVKDCVPGYWEDMKNKFQYAEFYRKLKINPEYGFQSYPIAGTAPDMALPNIQGTFFYKRSFDCNALTGENTLYFEGVQNTASVWLNDKFLGRHEGYSTPFEIEIPKDLLKQEDNVIVLSVSNHRLLGFANMPVSGLTSRAANECTGGITGKIELRTYHTPIRDVYIEISKDTKKIMVSLNKTQDKDFTWQVVDDANVLKEGKANADFSFDTTGLELWSPEKPKQYILKISCDGYVFEEKFGVRSLQVDGVHFKLNGNPYYLRGVCEHCYFPETIHPNHDYKYYRSMVKSFKSLGFNFIRFHTFVPEEEYMRAADELGMLIQVECPNNSTVKHWQDIVEFCRRHTSVVIYCCGNELHLNEPFIEHLNKCADIVHARTDSLFSPMSALRGVEYIFEKSCLDDVVKEPFEHNPKRFAVLNKFCDLYNSYTNAQNSYNSTKCDPALVDSWSSAYSKPRLSHEICIDGTYTNLEIKDRYKNLRVGQIDMFDSLERHLTEKGVIHKAPTYFKNSSEWQRRVRKYCFETTRMSENLAGYDFLGPIDTHWHTFGYDVGMMNEFYELKPGETIRNVLMYNSPTVILNDLAKKSNFYANEEVKVGFYTSHYGVKDLKNAQLNIRLIGDDGVLVKKSVNIDSIANGHVSHIYDFEFSVPGVNKPTAVKLYATLECDELFTENEWELYLFPEAQEVCKEGLVVADKLTGDQLRDLLSQGKKVVLFGHEPFASLPTTFRISLAGRTSDNLATVIDDHEILKDIPNEGFCGWQFAELMEGGKAVCFNDDSIAFEPIIEVVSSHKFVVKQSALFEINALGGKLLVCSFNFKENDACANWLKSNIIKYAKSENFNPKVTVTEEQLESLMLKDFKKAVKNENMAFNPNDKTAVQII